MKSCQFCGKEYEDDLIQCPECDGAVSEVALEEAPIVSEIAETDPIATDVHVEDAENPNTVFENEDEVTGHDEAGATEVDSEEIRTSEQDVLPEKAAPAKKKRRGLASAIIGIIFSALGICPYAIINLTILFGGVLVAIAFPYLLALSPFAIPALYVISIVTAVIALIICFIGFFTSVIALAKKNKLGIAGLTVSILSSALIVLTESVVIILPYVLPKAIQFLTSLTNIG